jgi:hypothetical protein
MRDAGAAVSAHVSRAGADTHQDTSALAMRRLRTALLAYLLAPLTILAAPSALRAQDCACGAPVYPARWSVFASTGGGLVHTDGINALLGAASYFAVSNDAIGFGGGAFTSWGPLRLGAEHVRLDAGSESTPAGRSARVEAQYTTLVVGWDLRPRGRLSVAPSLGVGRGSFDLTVGDRAGGATAPTTPAPTFAEVLASPGTESRIRGAHWVYEPLLAAELLVVRQRAQRRGITVGVRAGYRVAPNRPDWTYRGVAVSGGPVDQAAGPIVRLTIGVGGR